MMIVSLEAGTGAASFFFFFPHGDVTQIKQIRQSATKLHCMGPPISVLHTLHGMRYALLEFSIYIYTLYPKDAVSFHGKETGVLTLPQILPPPYFQLRLLCARVL